MHELAPRFYPSGSPVSPTSRFGGQPFSSALPRCWRSCSASARSPAGAPIAAPRPSSTASWPHVSCRPAPRRRPSSWSRRPRGIEATQQESIDQLQVVQDQLQTVAPPARLPAGRHQEAVRAGHDADRIDRWPAAVLCQRAPSDDPAPSVRKSEPQEGGAQRQPQARQVAGLKVSRLPIWRSRPPWRRLFCARSKNSQPL